MKVNCQKCGKKIESFGCDTPIPKNYKGMRIRIVKKISEDKSKMREMFYCEKCTDKAFFTWKRQLDKLISKKPIKYPEGLIECVRIMRRERHYKNIGKTRFPIHVWTLGKKTTEEFLNDDYMNY